MPYSPPCNNKGHSANGQVGWELERALATIGDQRSVAILTAAIGDEQRRIRLEAAAVMATVTEAPC